MQKVKRIENKKLLADMKNRPCVACGTLMYVEGHHVTTKGAGGDDTEDNIMPLCRFCHSLWHSRGVLGMVVQFPGVLNWLKQHNRTEVIENAKSKSKT